MKIPAFDSVKQYHLIPNDTFSQRHWDKHSDVWPLSSNGREITYFNKLHICSKIVNNVSVSLLSHTFHEHNFSPFEHIFFVKMLLVDKEHHFVFDLVDAMYATAYLFLYLRGALDTMLSSCVCACVRVCVKHSGRLIRAVCLRTGRKTKMAAFYRVTIVLS
jgi:hypothetical protein